MDTVKFYLILANEPDCCTILMPIADFYGALAIK